MANNEEVKEITGEFLVEKYHDMLHINSNYSAPIGLGIKEPGTYKIVMEESNKQGSYSINRVGSALCEVWQNGGVKMTICIRGLKKLIKGINLNRSYHIKGITKVEA